MKLHISSRLYQFLLIKANPSIPLFYCGINNADESEAKWIDIIESRISDADNNYLDLLSKRCPSVQAFFGWPDKKCIIHPDKEDRWNSPFKDFACYQRSTFESNHLFGVVFGKFDVVKMLPMPHHYWANIYKTLLQKPIANDEPPIFTEILSVPAYRVKDIEDRRENKKFGISNRSELSLRKRYGCLTFIRPPKLNSLKGKKSNIDILRTIRESLDTLSEKGFIPIHSAEFFLTLSMQYPYLIKSEFDSFAQVATFNRHLRCIAEDISTIISINPKDTNRVYEEEITFTILCKLSAQLSTRNSDSLINKIRFHLDSIALNSESLRIYNRGYYWDFAFSVKTKRVMTLVDIIVNKIRPLKGLTKILTIPYWPFENELKYTRTPWKHKTKKEPKRQSISRSWQELITRIPNLPVPAGKSLSYDIFNLRFYNLKFEIEWVYSYLQRLFEAWKAEDLDDNVITFLKLDEFAHEYLERMVPLLIACDKVNEIQNRILKIKSIDENYDTRSFEDLIQNSTKMMWEELLYIEKKVGTIKYLTSSLLANFNEKLEGKQVVTATEPYLRFGERAEIYDQICDSLNILFINYCGNLKKQWRGLVLPSFENDFAIHNRTRILYLPMDAKLNLHEKLLPLSHEAAHFVLSQMAEISGAQKYFVDKIWEPLHNDALAQLDKLKENIAKNSIDLKVITNKLNDLSIMLNRSKNVRYFGGSELFADLLAGICAGPGYFRSMGLVCFSPKTSFDIHGDYPPIWLRVYFGLTLYKKNYIPCYFKWIDRIYEAFDYIAQRHLEIDTDIKILNYKFRSNDSYLKSLFTSVGVAKKESSFFNYQFYLIKAFLSKKYYIQSLEKWCRVYLGRDFNFFRFNAKDTRDDKIDKSRKEYEICSEISKRIIYDDELVFNERPKRIAAASVLYPIKRPIFPSGRILQSIHFSQCD